MPRWTMDPDVTRRNDAAYWAAAMVLAIQNGDQPRQEEARENLRRLGYKLDVASRKAVPRD